MHPLLRVVETVVVGTAVAAVITERVVGVTMGLEVEIMMVEVVVAAVESVLMTLIREEMTVVMVKFLQLGINLMEDLVEITQRQVMVQMQFLLLQAIPVVLDHTLLPMELDLLPVVMVVRVMPGMVGVGVTLVDMMVVLLPGIREVFMLVLLRQSLR